MHLSSLVKRPFTGWCSLSKRQNLGRGIHSTLNTVSPSSDDSPSDKIKINKKFIEIYENFSVERVDHGEWEKILEVTKEWRKIASKKEKEILLFEHKKLMKSVETDSHTLELKEQISDASDNIKVCQINQLIIDGKLISSATIMADSCYIIDNIKAIIKKAIIKIGPSETSNELLVCRDITGTIQAIALHNLFRNHLDYLVTHPNNIKAPQSINPYPVRGSGTAIILYLALRTIKEGLPDLNVNCLDSAFPFYRKCKFKYSNLSISSTHMQLTIDKIKKYMLAPES